MKRHSLGEFSECNTNLGSQEECTWNYWEQQGESATVLVSASTLSTVISLSIKTHLNLASAKLITPTNTHPTHHGGALLNISSPADSAMWKSGPSQDVGSKHFRAGSWSRQGFEDAVLSCSRFTLTLSSDTAEQETHALGVQDVTCTHTHTHTHTRSQVANREN